MGLENRSAKRAKWPKIRCPFENGESQSTGFLRQNLDRSTQLVATAIIGIGRGASSRVNQELLGARPPRGSPHSLGSSSPTRKRQGCIGASLLAVADLQIGARHPKRAQGVGCTGRRSRTLVGTGWRASLQWSRGTSSSASRREWGRRGAWPRVKEPAARCRGAGTRRRLSVRLSSGARAHARHHCKFYLFVERRQC